MSFYLLVFFIFSTGCSGVQIRDFSKLDKAELKANSILKDVDYGILISKLNSKLKWDKKDTPVKLYAAPRNFISGDVASWNYYRKLNTESSIKCHAYVNLKENSDNSFSELIPASLICYEGQNIIGNLIFEPLAYKKN
jgi:hypothetical protein